MRSIFSPCYLDIKSEILEGLYQAEVNWPLDLYYEVRHFNFSKDLELHLFLKVPNATRNLSWQRGTPMYCLRGPSTPAEPCVRWGDFLLTFLRNVIVGNTLHGARDWILLLFGWEPRLAVELLRCLDSSSYCLAGCYSQRQAYRGLRSRDLVSDL